MTYNYRKPIDLSEISDKILKINLGINLITMVKEAAPAKKKDSGGDTYSVDNQTGGKKNVRV